MRFRLDCEPMGAVRMTQKGKYKDLSARKYLRYKGLIARQLKTQYKDDPIDAAVFVKAIFHMPVPPSWSKKKQAAAVGQLHMKKPDIDNLVKGLFDATNKIIWADDNRVAKMEAVKIYSEQPGIEMVVEKLEAEVE